MFYLGICAITIMSTSFHCKAPHPKGPKITKVDHKLKAV